jgi:universal stress protein E
MKKMVRVIVAGVAEMPLGGTTRPDPVLETAVELAQRLEAKLHLVRCLERSYRGSGMDPQKSCAAAAGEDQRALVEQGLRAQVGRLQAGGRIQCHAIEGKAEIQLCAFGEEVGADLLIVGATRHGESFENRLGGTAEAVLQRSQIPVLVVRRPVQRSAPRVLLTTDLSELSPAVHEFGLETAEELLGAAPLELRTLLVCRYEGATTARLSREMMVGAATAKLGEFLGSRRQPKWPMIGRVRIGNPSTEIRREAEEWDVELIILGSHRRWDGSSWLLGSTAATTLRGSRCNALVIPTTCGVVWQRSSEEERVRRASSCFPGTEEHQETELELIAH